MHNKKYSKLFDRVSNLFNLLSNPDRVRIIGLLKDREMDVNELHEKLEISQSRVSQHLKLLKLNSLVEERREGKHVYYKVKDARISNIVESALQFQMIGTVADADVMLTMKELATLWHI